MCRGLVTIDTGHGLCATTVLSRSGWCLPALSCHKMSPRDVMSVPAVPHCVGCVGLGGVQQGSQEFRT